MAVLVFDASTAILLAKVGLLRSVATKGDAWIGERAALEAVAKASEDAVAIATLIEEGLIRQAAVRKNTDPLEADFRLDSGEAEAILLAQDKSALCATDDGPAIRCCKVLGVRLATAVGFLVGLTEAGELDMELALSLLSKLERAGRYRVRILEDAAGRIRATGKQEERP